MSYIPKLTTIEQNNDVLDSEELISKVNTILNKPNITSFEKSKGLTIIGKRLWADTYFDKNDLYGNIHLKKALKYNKNNYDALISLTIIYMCYPYPNTLITELEYINYIQRLIKHYRLLSQEQQIRTFYAIDFYLNEQLNWIKNWEYSWYTKEKTIVLKNNLKNDINVLNNILSIDKNNYSALLTLIAIFNKYPYPFYDLLTEQDYIYYVQKLIKDFSKLTLIQQNKLLCYINEYFNIRINIIGKYGYKWYLDYKNNKDQ